MKNFIKILSVVMTLVLSSVAFADRIKIPENTQANDLVMSQDYVQQQFK